MKLIVPGIAPAAGVTVNEPGGTPAVDTVVVNVPEPDTETVPVWPHPTVSAVGDTTIVFATTGGGASPAGPATPTTRAVSTTRFCVSVTMSWLAPHPVWVARKLPPLVVTIEGKTVTKLGNGVFTV